MNNQEFMQLVTADLEKRGASISGLIINVGDKLQVISYNDKGVVDFLSDKVDAISVYKKHDDGGISPMFSVGGGSND